MTTTALDLPTLPSTVTGASLIPNFDELADIQVALKYLYYGGTTSSSSKGIYGALSGLKNYIDAAVTGVNVHENVKMATTAVLGTTGNLVGGTITTTYTNGTADASGGTGIGATLTIATSSNWTAITIDGQSLVVNDRVLIKNQTTALQNGIYTVTSVGAVGNTTSFVFTRATDSNNSISGSVGEGDFTFVSSGTTNGNTSWILTSATPTGTGPAGTIKIGTDPISFIQFGSVSFGSQTANTIFAGPTSGAAATPTFRTLNYQDLSTLSTPTVSGQVPYYAPAGNGVAWTAGTLSLPSSSSLTLSGGFALTLTQTASTNVTLPTSGTLATIDTAQTFTGTKTFNTVYNIQPTPTAFTATTNTMTAAQMLGGIITVTQTAATTVNFPLGGTIEAGWGSLITNASVDLSIINLGTTSGAVTIGANGNSFTGSTSIPIGTSARFRIVRNSTNAYTIYRI